MSVLTLGSLCLPYPAICMIVHEETFEILTKVKALAMIRDIDTSANNAAKRNGNHETRAYGSKPAGPSRHINAWKKLLFKKIININILYRLYSPDIDNSLYAFQMW